MQQFLASAPTSKPLSVGLVTDAKIFQKPSPSVPDSILQSSLSSSHLRSSCSHGALLELSIKRSLLHINPMRAVLPTACESSSCNFALKEMEPSRKVNWSTLSLAFATGIAALTCVGSAVASSQLVIPSVARSPLVARCGRELLVSAWMGLAAGCLHTLTGPDHLAALAPLSIGRSKLESVAVGALWGCGHDAGQVIFGILFLLLKDKLQIELLRTWGARVVGMTLVTIGITGMKEAHEAALLPYLAANGSTLVPNSLTHAEPINGARRDTGFTTFATGIVHGLQPDALIMILPALALPSRFAGAAFLSMFLVGTILSMSGYTAFIGSCSNALQKRIPRITEHLAWGSSLVAILVGVGILAGELFGLSIF